MSSRPVVLVAGDFVRESVAKAILGESVDSSSTLTIDNKYYRADVEIIVGNEDSHSYFLENAEHIQALILAFDANSARSFSLVTHWKDILENNAEGLEMVSCAAVGSSFERNEWSSEKWGTINPQEWCIQYNMEFVRVNPELLEKKPEVGEGECVPRLLEALHSVMWPNMKMKPRSSHTNISEVPPPSVDEISGKVVSQVADGEEVVQDQNANSENTSGEVKTSTPTISNIATSALEKEDGLVEQLVGEIPADPEEDFTDLDENEDISFDRIFQNMVQGIEQARNSIAAGTSNDEERRKRAADMIEQFAKWANLEDFGEED